MRACMGANHVTRFARVDFHSDKRIFGIKDEDRLLHIYFIGKTGTGKSTLLENMALKDLERGNGFALIDPHGDLVRRIAARVPESRRQDIIYLDATDPSQPFGYNPLRHVREDRIALAASGMMDVFKKMWPDAWGVRMEHILRNVLMALLEQQDATLHDVLRIFSDKAFRRRVAKSLRNEPVRRFLLKEFDQFSFGYRADGTAPIQNKVGAFLADPLLARILTTPEKDVRIRRIMDEGKVLLVNLAKGRSARTARRFSAVYSSPRSGLPPIAAPTCPKHSAAIFLYTSTSSKASPLLPWRACYRSCANTASDSRSHTSISTSWSPTYGMRSLAMSARSSHSASAQRMRRTSSANSMRNSRRRISCSSPITAFTSN